MAETVNNPPFATVNGEPQAPPATGPNKGVDLTVEPTGGKGKGGPGDLFESRAQKKGDNGYNKESVPAGGAILKADPKGTSVDAGGYSTGPARMGKPPFRLKGGTVGEADEGEEG